MCCSNQAAPVAPQVEQMKKAQKGITVCAFNAKVALSAVRVARDETVQFRYAGHL
jgi:hypothetical protein